MDYLSFENKEVFENWLSINLDHQGIYILFDKKNKNTLNANDALDVALCYGWIDGKIKKIDDQFYVKYFAKRQKSSIWSTKNKHRIHELIALNLVKPSGHQAIFNAKKNGQWEKSDHLPENKTIDNFMMLFNNHPKAIQNFLQMSTSTQMTYAGYYYQAKKSETQIKRLEMIIERLNHNLKLF